MSSQDRSAGYDGDLGLERSDTMESGSVGSTAGGSKSSEKGGLHAARAQPTTTAPQCVLQRPRELDSQPRPSRSAQYRSRASWTREHARHAVLRFEDYDTREANLHDSEILTPEMHSHSVKCSLEAIKSLDAEILDPDQENRSRPFQSLTACLLALQGAADSGHIPGHHFEDAAENCAFMRLEECENTSQSVQDETMSVDESDVISDYLIIAPYQRPSPKAQETEVHGQAGSANVRWRATREKHVAFESFSDQREAIDGVARLLVQDWMSLRKRPKISYSQAGITEVASRAGNGSSRSKTAGKQAASTSHQSIGRRRPRQRCDDGVLRDQNGDDEDEGGDDDPAPNRHKKTRPNSRHADLRILACPYHKFDRRRYSKYNVNEDEKSYRGCEGRYLTSIPRLKQHLYRVHTKPPYYCSSCFEVFDTEIQATAHTRRRPPCEVQLPKFEERLTDRQLLGLRRKHHGQTVEQAWNTIWKILFPSAEPPSSPYLDDDIHDEVQDFLRHFRRHAPAMIARSIRSATTQTGQISPILMDQVVDSAVQLAISNIQASTVGADSPPQAASPVTSISTSSPIGSSLVPAEGMIQFDLFETECNPTHASSFLHDPVSHLPQSSIPPASFTTLRHPPQPAYHSAWCHSPHLMHHSASQLHPPQPVVPPSHLSSTYHAHPLQPSRYNTTYQLSANNSLLQHPPYGLPLTLPDLDTTPLPSDWDLATPQDEALPSYSRWQSSSPPAWMLSQPNTAMPGTRAGPAFAS